MNAVGFVCRRNVLVGLMGACAASAQAQWVEQTFLLLPGWNSVYLEVDPVDSAADAVFETQPVGGIERVWAWLPSNGGGECSDPLDPGCGAQTDTAWVVWLPPENPSSVVNSLSTVRGGRVYLIKSRAVASLKVVGKPSVSSVPWRTGINLAGFHVDPENVPTFGTYLAPSAMHDGAEVYAMNPAGTLARIANLESPIAPKRGYWVSSAGATDYDGPLSIAGSARFGFLYGRHQVEHRLDVENLSSEARTVTMTVGSSAEPPGLNLPSDAGVIPMRLRNYVAQDVLYELVDFDPGNPTNFDLAAANPGAPQEARHMLRVSVLRQGQPEAVVNSDGSGSQYQGILTVNDGVGFRRWLPVSGEVPNQAGLYVGTVSVDAVAWVQADARIVLRADEEGGYEDPEWDCNRNGVSDASDITSGTSQDADENGVPDECEGPADTTTPRPTQGPFTFPVIVHYDGVGSYTFPREVTVLYAPGEKDTPGRYVLATPDCLNCDQLLAGSFVDGERFARRIGTAAFSFEHDLPMTGDFSSSLQGYTEVGADDRLNPFRHIYHSHHNGDQPGEVVGVSRRFAFDFTCPPPAGQSTPPSLGDTLLMGCYTETLGGVTVGEPPGETVPGLHKRDINVSGRFELRRVSNISILNDGQGGGVR